MHLELSCTQPLSFTLKQTLQTVQSCRPSIAADAEEKLIPVPASSVPAFLLAGRDKDDWGSSHYSSAEDDSYFMVAQQMMLPAWETDVKVKLKGTCILSRTAGLIDVRIWERACTVPYGWPGSTASLRRRGNPRCKRQTERRPEREIQSSCTFKKNSNTTWHSSYSCVV